MSPYRQFAEECIILTQKTLQAVFPELSVTLNHEIPAKLEFGELAVPVFHIAKKINKKPKDLAEILIENINPSNSRFIKEVVIGGAGYLNFFANYDSFANLVINSIRTLDTSYGKSEAKKKEKIIVEYLSPNPNSPLHIGHARNAILGSSLVKVLQTQSHDVCSHIYIDDVGRQVAICVQGLRMVDRDTQPSDMKSDQFVGTIYTITNALTEIQKAKKEQNDLAEWESIAEELKKAQPSIFDQISNNSENIDLDAEISTLISLYENQDEQTVQLFRSLVDLVLGGFKETFKTIDIAFESYDWESSFIWDGSVTKILNELKMTPFVTELDGALVFDCEKAATEFNIKESLGVKETHEIPPMTLMRSDGTTLYTTRDIAYSKWKLDQSDRVINVIGKEQTLPQLQIRIALYVLGEDGSRQIHYAYELVKLPEFKMSSRRGRYIGFDDLIDEATTRALEEVNTRSPHLSEDEKRSIAEVVGIGAVKYSILNAVPTKIVTFTWNKVLDFEQNSGPFIQYAHARACNILKKAKKTPKTANYNLVDEELEKLLVQKLSLFPEIISKVAEELRPDIVCEYANNLASIFNSFYASIPVLAAETDELRNLRLLIVNSVRIVLRNALKLMGIVAPSRM
ncbi:arginine--tRNA ligase [Candidatus Borrarchaeum sp.]|uniref:arginine--tRNA ligase n=1 Tax=Candidatus Borrarchaeum sp. TaxID=2846742 RepID=UPI00257D9903|nr:arginine--tRNA ligase [Candidatus Borrarchaeum sp.]